MFVPRALRLKGVREQPRPKAANVSPDSSMNGPAARNEQGLDEELKKMSAVSSAALPGRAEPKTANANTRFTIKEVTSEHIAQFAAGVELIFTDYAHQEKERASWLQEHYRSVDGMDKFIHLTAILNHPNIAHMKPEASQPLLQQAIRDHASNFLELSKNGYHVRRKPSSYPLHFLPENSFEICNDEGLAFWDERTIYVEPHLRSLCKNPGRVAQWLETHGQLRSKWLPIQAVHMLWNSCAFVVLSSSVMHDDIWQKWRAAEKPANWKIMTKVEHTKRTAEYVALLANQNPRWIYKNRSHGENLPAIARPATLPLSIDAISKYDKEAQDSKRRKRRKIGKSTDFANKDSIDTRELDTEKAANESMTG